MYKVDYMPIVTMHDIVDAVEKRFGHVLETQDLFGEEISNGSYYSYWLDRDREIKNMNDREVLVYLFVKAVMTKDFDLHTPRVLVDISW